MNGLAPGLAESYAHPISEVLIACDTSLNGLQASSVAERQHFFGPNKLPEQKPTPLVVIFLRQFANPLIYILIIAAIVSVLIADLKDALFICIVLLINSAIGAYQEAHAEQAGHALRGLLRTYALVERGGELRQISADEVVPGDIVWLESGNRVPADIRLISGQGLEIDESLLTGESLAAAKEPGWIGTVPTSPGDQQNMAFAGSMVTRGRSKGVVVSTGMQTEVGQLALNILGATDTKPPLIIRMERFTSVAAIVTLAAACLIGMLGIALGGYSLAEAFFLVVALAVSAIPEGLPVAMTVALSVAATRMSQRNVIVRRLTAVEGLGSCTLIATDKTGTLTCNELTARELFLADGASYQITGVGFQPEGTILQDGALADHKGHPQFAEALRAALLCNEGELYHRAGNWGWRGDAVDVAMLVLGQKAGFTRRTLLEEFPQVGVIPFEPEHRFAASFHRTGESITVFVKGAPEQLLEMCSRNLTSVDRVRLEDVASKMAQRGLRVIALASARMHQLKSLLEIREAVDLDFLGMVGMIDPLRLGVRDAIDRCRSAGVQVTMVTGDHRVTATAIARELGLIERDDEVVTAEEVTGKEEAQLASLIGRVRVFARVTPRQKLEIVTAARRAGHFVAVTGDGANDAPALRAANIGVAMGVTGTDVAREAAELVIADDNFSSIVAGIEEGRVAYDNIRKVIHLLVPTGGAELLMVLLSVAFGLPIPLLPVQLLWLNLVTDGIQGVALAFEPGEGSILLRKPRPPQEPIFNRLMIDRTVLAVCMMGVGGFLVYFGALRSGMPLPDARNLLLLVMVLLEIFHVGNCRSETQSAFALSPLRSPVLFFGTIAAFLVHLASMYVPVLQDVLATKPVDFMTWGLALGIGCLIVPTIEAHKWLWREQP